jgi:hypothetical protein
MKKRGFEDLGPESHRLPARTFSALRRENGGSIRMDWSTP